MCIPYLQICLFTKMYFIPQVNAHHASEVSHRHAQSRETRSCQVHLLSCSHTRQPPAFLSQLSPCKWVTCSWSTRAGVFALLCCLQVMSLFQTVPRRGRKCSSVPKPREPVRCLVLSRLPQAQVIVPLAGSSMLMHQQHVLTKASVNETHTPGYILLSWPKYCGQRLRHLPCVSSGCDLGFTLRYRHGFVGYNYHQKQDSME